MMMILNYGAAANHTHKDIMDFEMYANGVALAVGRRSWPLKAMTTSCTGAGIGQAGRTTWWW